LGQNSTLADTLSGSKVEQKNKIKINKRRLIKGQTKMLNEKKRNQTCKAK
jgi:hypothetical protein